MTRVAATCSTLALGLLALGFAGCPDPGASQCVQTAIPLAETLVTQTRSLNLLQTSGTMALVGLDNTTVRWSLIDREGKLDSAEGFALPEHIAGPWFALTGVGGANNQMVAIYVAKKADDPTVTQVMAIAQNVGGTLVAPREIFATVSGTNPDSLRVSVGSAPSGLSAMVAIGFENQAGADVKIFSLGENAQTDDTKTIMVPTNWACPFWSNSGRSEAPLNFSFADKAAVPKFIVTEVQENAMETFRVFMDAKIEQYCPIVAPKTGGFVLAWRNATEIRGGDYRFANALAPMQDSKTYPLINESSFDGTVPPLAGVAAMGDRTALLWLKPTGPEVGLFDQKDQSHIGKDLLLTVGAGNLGTVSSVSENNAMFVTYRDSAGPRRLIKVTCPGG